MDEENKSELSNNIHDNSETILHKNIEIEPDANLEATIIKRQLNNKLKNKIYLTDLIFDSEHKHKITELTGLTDEMIKKHGISTSQIDEMLTKRYKDALPNAHQSLYNMHILENDIELPKNVDIKGLEKTKIESPQQPSDSHKGRKPK